MRHFFCIIIFSTLFFSCQEKHPMADKLCNCYTQLHRAQEEVEINFWTDSCNVLYIDILNQLKKSESEQIKFQRAYSRCQ
jgi:alpha-D-ribose 1-methylphosphonate 5-triphosphate synthase subunit PhnI